MPRTLTPVAPPPPAAQRTGTREAILALAEDLLQERGFNAFSYEHIARQLGVRKAAIHYHFPTKAELGLSVIERYRAQFAQWRAGHRARGTAPLPLLRSYVAIPLRYLRNGRKACPLGVLEAEFPTLPEPICAAVRELDRDIRDFLTGVLENGRRAGQFHFDGEAADRALMIVAALQGALQIARAAGSGAFRRVVRQLEYDLGIPGDPGCPRHTTGR